MLTHRFDEALRQAADLHRGDKRKGTEIPYLAHLLSVAGIALTHGATEDEAIAALLHDAIEDVNHPKEQIARDFGPAVADIVAACSDTDQTPKPPWEQRKRDYLAHLPEASTSTLLVSASDKLDNARAILLDYRQLGDDLFDRFQGGKSGTLWYYRSLVEVYRQTDRVPPALLGELDRVVSELETLAG